MYRGGASSRGPSSRFDGRFLDATTQVRDIRLFELNLRKSLNALRGLRRRYLCIVVLLVSNSAFWTWRLREKLSDHLSRTNEEEMRLWFAWAVLGITPLLVFFVTGVYRRTIVEPSRFIEQLNRSLAQYYVAYSEETGRLLRTQPNNQPEYRQPLRLRAPQRARPM